jgi:hypothetical protein
VPHACNPSYLGDWVQKDHSSRPAQASSSHEPIFKITRAQWTGGVEHLLCKCEALSSNPNTIKKKKKSVCLNLVNWMCCLPNPVTLLCQCDSITGVALGGWLNHLYGAWD